MKYEIILYWSEDDSAYIAEVPELADCMADGAAAGEALHNAEIIAKEWIEAAQELGRHPEVVGSSPAAVTKKLLRTKRF